MANKSFTPIHNNTKYVIKEQYWIRKLENEKLEIKFKKDFITIVNKNENSKIYDLNTTENITSTYSNGIDNLNIGIVVEIKTIKIYCNSSYFPYNKYYDKYDNDVDCWYGNNLILKEVL